MVRSSLAVALGIDWPLVSGTLAAVLAVSTAAALLVRRGRRHAVA